MLFFNACIFTPDGYLSGGFRVENGRFAEIIPGLTHGDGTDLRGAKVLPGLVDIHIHGAMGADFSDGSLSGLATIGKYLARNGITGFAPASMSLPYEKLEASYITAKQFCEDRPSSCARVVGIHMEGPFISGNRKGSHNEGFLCNPDFDAFYDLYQKSGGLIKIVDLAPELPGSDTFIKQAGKLCSVSVAHTDADYDQAAAAFDAGSDHLTHLFNAMPGIHHRKPGVICAASEREHVTAELICDGVHVHQSAVRLAFNIFRNRICLVSDSIRCCGMPDGEYELSGQKVIFNNGVARLRDGTIAGSAVNLFDCMKNAVRFGIPEKDAILAATLIPARAAGDESVGTIEAGRLADFVVCDRDLNIKQVYMDGSMMSPRDSKGSPRGSSA